MTVAKLRNAHEASFARQMMGRPAVCLAALAALAAALLLAVVIVLAPPAALADDSDAVLGHSEDGTVAYTTLVDAWAAAVSGTTVVMDDDWYTTGVLTVDEGQSATIKMNGHKIYRDLSGDVSKGSVLWVAADASLTLDGSGFETTFTIKENAVGGEQQVTSGGLVTGGYSSNSGGGIEMKGDSTVTLINVAVSGNASSGHGGGVSMGEKGGTLVMTDAAIEYNEALHSFTSWSLGGGVYIDTPHNTIKMTRSSISHNRAQLGGGIYCSTDNASIYMYEGSKIDSNLAYYGGDLENSNGGGIYINRSSFIIEGDGTALISNNQANKAGAGIYIDSVSSGTETGTIKGIKFKWNKSAKAGGIWCKQQNITIENCVFFRCEAKTDAGALYIAEENTTVRGCTFTKNAAGDYAGAIYNYEDGTLIDSCTMTGNICGIEGGAVWTDWDYDIALAGTVVIKDNKRLDGAADDVFLDTRSGGGSKAYLTGSLEKGSKVGVRTGYEKDRLIAEKFSDNGGFSLFIDMAGYYVTYGSDHSGDAWQRKGEATFLVVADGVETTSYKQGDAVTVNALKGNASKAFWRWSADSSIGLTPFADYVPDPTVRTLKFAMPQNNVILVSEYVARTGSVSLAVDAPRVGEELPSTATLSWTDADGQAQSKEVAVSWLEVTSAGTLQAEGKTKPGTTYALSACIAMDGSEGLAFALDMGTADVLVSFRASDGTLSSVGAASAAVDADTEALSLVSNTYALPKAKLASVEPACATVAEGTSEADLREQLAISALGTDEYGNEVALTADASTADLSALLSKGYAAVPEGGKATVSLPVSNDAVDNPGDLALEVTVTVEPTNLQVTFDAAGGKPTPKAQSVRWGTVVSEPDVPAIAGQTFLGWFTEGSDVAWDFTTPVTSALKLTAHWASSALSVTFDSAGGTPAPEAQSVAYGGLAKEPAAPVLAGQTFLGWFAEGSQTAFDFKTPVTASLKLTARWQTVVLSVSFDAAGGSPAPAAQSVTYGVCAQKPADPQREGYTFQGWFAEGAQSAWDFETPVTASLKLTAHWQPVQHTVDLVFANGQGTQRVSVAHDSALAAPAAPKRDGYTFRGWYTDSGTRYGFSAPVTCDFTLTAWWIPNSAATFTDVANDSWYASWVARAASLGLMTGYTDGVGASTGLFGPDDAVTRGQVATVLWRMAGSPKADKGASFPDVEEGLYYAEAVSWCSQVGIVTGYTAGPNKGRFVPDGLVTREEMAVMVARFEGLWAKVDTSNAPTANFERCVDTASVSDWARASVTWTAASGVLTGKEIASGSATVLRLDPQEGATRAQAAKVFVRAWEIANGAEPYEAQASEVAQGADDAAAQAADGAGQATFDEVTFADVATASGQASETSAIEEVQAAGEAQTATETQPTGEVQATEGTQTAGQPQPADEAQPNGDQQTFEAAQTADGAQPSSVPVEDALQPEFDAEPTPEAL